MLIAQHQPYVDLRKCGEEFGDHRQYVEPAEDDGCGDDEVATRLVVFAGGGALGSGHVLGHRDDAM